MRTFERIATFTVAFVCAGCVSASSYETTAQGLFGQQRFGSYQGLDLHWLPLDEDEIYAISSAERLESQNALEACAQELDAVHDRPPGESMRVVQLIQCMRDRGWHLLFDEIFIVS